MKLNKNFSNVTSLIDKIRPLQNFYNKLREIDNFGLTQEELEEDLKRNPEYLHFPKLKGN